jgi:hypothetical protein
MQTETNWEVVATFNLAKRGLTHVPGELAFTHKGEKVTLSIEKSVYRGVFMMVHDGPRPPRQFRERTGDFDWNLIAAHIIDVAEARLPRQHVAAPTPAQVRAMNQPLADELATITGAGPTSRLRIEPSSSRPGHVRVQLDGVDLDPTSVMALFTSAATAARPKPVLPPGPGKRR